MTRTDPPGRSRTTPAGRHSDAAGTADGRDDEGVGRFVERFARHLTDAGFPRMPARVFVAILVADSGERTAADLGQVLRVSAAAVSGGVRYLEQIGLVVRERRPGERRDHYRLYDDVWYEVLTRQDSQYARWERDLADGMAAVGPDTPAGVRLGETRQFFAFLREAFPRLLAEWRESREPGPAR